MKLLGIFLILIISLSVINAANFPAPFVPGSPAKGTTTTIVYGGPGTYTPSSVPTTSVSNYLTSNVAVGSPEPTTRISISKSRRQLKEEANCKNSGCYYEGVCYPYGYIIEDKTRWYLSESVENLSNPPHMKKYCADKATIYYPNGKPRMTVKDTFVDQKEIGTECQNNFQCLTNYCLNNICESQSEEIVRIVKKEISNNKNMGPSNNSNEDLDNKKISSISGLAIEEEIPQEIVTNQKEEINQENKFGKILNWFANMFNSNLKSSSTGNILNENKNNEKISLTKALSLCYKKAEECAKKETSSNVEYNYYKSALRQSCTQIYSAYSLSSQESIMMETSELEDFNKEGYETIINFAEDLC